MHAQRSRGGALCSVHLPVSLAEGKICMCSWGPFMLQPSISLEIRIDATNVLREQSSSGSPPSGPLSCLMLCFPSISHQELHEGQPLPGDTGHHQLGETL